MRTYPLALGMILLAAPAPAQTPADWAKFFEGGKGAASRSALPSVAQSPDVPALPQASEQNPFFGLKQGAADAGKDGPIHRLQAVLKGWNPKLACDKPGRYGANTSRALTLFKAVYGLGQDGSSMDEQSARYLLAMETKDFWRNPPEKPVGGEVLYRASRYIGLPYVLGASGRKSMDCALLTRLALVQAGVAPEDISRMADEQFRDAENGANGLKLRGAKEKPEPGDLVFFKNTSWQAGEAYKRVTHVGLYVGNGLILAASSSRGKVTLHPLDDFEPSQIAGFAAPTKG